jgi:hypothetical protein
LDELDAVFVVMRKDKAGHLSSVHPRIEAAQTESNLKYFSANAYQLNIGSGKAVIKLYQQNCNLDHLRDPK